MKKKLSYLLIIAILVMFGINTANADSFTKGAKWNRSSASEKANSSSNYNLKANNEPILYRHYLMKPVGTSTGNYDAYCLDPGLISETNVTYEVDRVLGSDKSSEEYDMGILKMLSLGYNYHNTELDFVVNNTNSTVSGEELYEATNLAIRAFTSGVFDYSRYGTTKVDGAYKTINSGYANFGIKWASDNKTAASAAIGRDWSESIFNNYTWRDANVKISNQNDTGLKVIYAAQYLLREGINEAADVRKNGIRAPKIEVSVKNTENIRKTETRIKEWLYIDFNIKNFNEETGTVKYINIDCPKCDQNNINIGRIQYQDKDGDWQDLENETNIVKHINNDIAKLRINVEKDANNDDCSDTSFTINYRYYTPNLGYTGVVLKKGENQRFVAVKKIIADNANLEEGQAEGTISCGKEACETELATPSCENGDEGYVKAPTNVKACILDSNDEADNSYRLGSSVGGLSSNNEYCQVFCKEDYQNITLQSAIEKVTCGGYFKLTSHIEGKKSCYTSGGDTADKRIDRDQFIKDIIQNQEDMIINYDLYLNYKAAVEDIHDVSEECRGCSDGGGCKNVTGYKTGDLDSHTYTKYIVDSVDDETGLVTSKSFNAKHIYDEAPHKGSCTCSSYDGDGNCTGCSSSCTNGDLDGLTKRLEEKRDDYKAKYEQAYKDFIENLKNYNACTTGWINKFLLEEQKISFEYNEYQGDKESTTSYQPYFKLIEETDKGNYLVPVDDDYETKTSIEVCLENADSDYNCIGRSEIIDLPDGDKEEELNIDSLGKDYYYNSIYKKVFDTDAQFTICTEDGGCKLTPYDVSEAAFVKKVVEKEQDYITPTVFCQTAVNGKITTDCDREDFNLEPIKNGLPVSSKLVGGGDFILKLENFGEFYNSGDLGRIFGDVDSDNVIANVQQETKDEDETFSGTYKCNYKTDCRPNDCPECIWDCEDGVCKWEECPECKFTCLNCIWNLDKLQINFKTISSSNVNSANRTFGYNWITSTSMEELKLLTEKASTTIDEIEEVNEMIYDNSTVTAENKIADGSSLAFSIKLTPEIIKEIQRYNEEVEEVGGYGNDSLACYDYTDSEGNVLKNIYCYSTFIDELIDKYGDNIIYSENRLSNNRENSQNSSYWQTWDGYIYNESVIGGPSWK